MLKRNETLKSPGSLWAEYSMLKATIFLNEGVDISKFATLIAFLKRKNVGHRPKKSKVFTHQDLIKFLHESSNEHYLNIKVAMLFGIAGACRRDELYNMKIEDIKDNGSYISVVIPNTKTNIQRSFTIVNQENDIDMINYLEIVRKYLNLRLQYSKLSQLFLSMRNGKICNQVVGRNTIGSWPSKIAKCLNLAEPQLYTGHAFRRSSATFLANKGVDVLGLKRHGGWRSSSVAEGYVEDSIHNKLEFSRKILHENPENISKNIETPSASISFQNTEVSNTENTVLEDTVFAKVPMNFNNSSNCTFNFVYNKN